MNRTGKKYREIREGDKGKKRKSKGRRRLRNKDMEKIFPFECKQIFLQ
jgi:hypothetical protein